MHHLGSIMHRLAIERQILGIQSQNFRFRT